MCFLPITRTYRGSWLYRGTRRVFPKCDCSCCGCAHLARSARSFCETASDPVPLCPRQRKTVANASHRDDILRLARIGFHDLANPTDMHVERARIPHIIGVPDLLHDLEPLERLVRVAHERFHQRDQLGRQLLFVPRRGQRLFGEVERERARLEQLPSASPRNVRFG